MKKQMHDEQKNKAPLTLLNKLHKNQQTLARQLSQRNRILFLYRRAVGRDSLVARNLIKKIDYKNDAQLLSYIAQTYYDECRLFPSGEPREKIDWKKWRMAERYIIDAFSRNSDCMDILWLMGRIRQINGQSDVAIFCFEKILKIGTRKIKTDNCYLEKELRQKYVNDSKLVLYHLYFKSNSTLAKRYLKRYLRGVESGIDTIFRPIENFLIE